jgi:chemotaxis response regulator CheB
MRGVDPMSQAVPGSPAVGPRVEVVALVTSAGGMDALTTVLRQPPDDYIVKPPRRPRRPRRRRLQP